MAKLHPYIIDDFNGEDYLLVWAVSTTQARKLAWDEYGPPRKDLWGFPTGKEYDADVYRIDLPEGVQPPEKAGLECRPDVIIIAEEILLRRASESQD